MDAERRNLCFVSVLRFLHCVFEPIEEVSKEKKVMSMTDESRKKIKIKHSSPILPSDFESRIKELNDDNIIFLMHKTLFLSDLDTNINRLSIPRKKITNNFLTETEIIKLEKR
ncbi:hypothetical protein Fmac_025175 [Flemingia macrophylla]|uniref:Translocon at the inner envelope membrane of chloroplasts 214 n=1 Tax=Flemingia macrophylla TaxID=520843 RepID=A0ABD1LRG3_9FABA